MRCGSAAALERGVAGAEAGGAGTAGAEAEEPASGCGSRAMARRCRLAPRYS